MWGAKELLFLSDGLVFWIHFYVLFTIELPSVCHTRTPRNHPSLASHRTLSYHRHRSGCKGVSLLNDRTFLIFCAFPSQVSTLSVVSHSSAGFLNFNTMDILCQVYVFLVMATKHASLGAKLPLWRTSRLVEDKMLGQNTPMEN